MNKQDLIEEMKQGIENVVNGVTDLYNSQFLSPHDIASYIEDKYNVEHIDFDTNGWQWDYWITYVINDKKYLVSGSGYYGRLSFQESEDW